MKRFLLLLTVLAIASIGFAKDDIPTYGKSDSQILAMGQDKWMSFCGDKDGSNLGMILASRAYERAAGRRNDKLFRRLPLGATSDMRRLRKLMDDFSGQCHAIGSFNSGGGSMWSVFDAAGRADVEDVLYIASGGIGKRAPAMRVSAVTAQLGRAESAIHKNPSNDQYGGLKETDAMKALVAAKADFRSIAAIASRLARPRSDAVLKLCFDQIKLGTDGG